MKRIFTIITLSFAINAIGSVVAVPAENVNKIAISESKMESVTIVGTVMLKGGIWVISGRENMNGEMKDYYPGNLKQAYKIEGQKVMVQAIFIPIPENVRYAGTPITIKTIRLI